MNMTKMRMINELNIKCFCLSSIYHLQLQRQARRLITLVKEKKGVVLPTIKTTSLIKTLKIEFYFLLKEKKLKDKAEIKQGIAI